MKKVKIGVIGCGNISPIYLTAPKTFKILDIAACADIDLERAKARAKEFNIPKACGVQELLEDPEIEIVVNLTIPKVHGRVALEALKAGKNVHNEKPLALSREEGRKILALAKSRNLRVGCAPDTFLGGGLQTCRKLVDEGAIGEPVAATAFMLGHGPENWHPNPGIFYQPGAGPMLDMGPYYLTAMVHLLGPIRRVTGSARITFPKRLITSQPQKGTWIKVKTPTHIAAVLDFHSGAIGTLATSNDVWACELPRIEIYGSEGTLSVPDPNTFGGPVRLRRREDTKWREVPLTHGYTQNSRGIGVADMAYALSSGRLHRTNGEMAFHILDAMLASLEASRTGKHIVLKSTCKRPAPLPRGLKNGFLDN